MKHILILLFVVIMLLTVSCTPKFEIIDEYAKLPVTGYTENGYRVIKIIGSNLEYLPSRIVVNHNDKVKIILTAEGERRGLIIEQHEINIVAEKFSTSEAEFVANKKGRFEFGCQIYCGESPEKFRGELIVK